MIIYIIFLLGIFLFEFIDKLHIPQKKNSKSYKYNDIKKISFNLEDNHFDYQNKKYSFAMILAIFTIFCFSAFRYNVGWDYEGYYNTIKYGLVTNVLLNKEYLTILLVEVAKNTGIINLYFFVNSFVCIFFISKTIRKYSEDYWLSIILFVCFPLFFLNSLSVIRTFSALALTFYGVKYIEKKQFIKYLLIVLVASMFHKAAAIAIIFYFTKELKLKTYKVIIILMSLPIVSRLLNTLIIKYLPMYSTYTQETTYQEGTKAIFIFIFIGIIALLLRDKITYKDDKTKIYYNNFFVGISIYLMFFSQGTMGHRLSLFGTIYSLLLIPKMVSVFELKKDRTLIKAIIYILCVIMFLYTVNIGSITYIPYRTIFKIY